MRQFYIRNVFKKKRVQKSTNLQNNSHSQYFQLYMLSWLPQHQGPALPQAHHWKIMNLLILFLLKRILKRILIFYVRTHNKIIFEMTGKCFSPKIYPRRQLSCRFWCFILQQKNEVTYDLWHSFTNNNLLTLISSWKWNFEYLHCVLRNTKN